MSDVDDAPMVRSKPNPTPKSLPSESIASEPLIAAPSSQTKEQTPSSFLDTEREKLVTTDVHAEWAHGETYAGEKFLVPATAGTLEVFLNPQYINIGIVIAVMPIFTNFILSFIVGVPIWVNIVWFLFFRGCYNIGLGYLLHVQSNYDQITKWYQDYAKKQPSSPLGSFINRLVDGGLPPGTKQAEFPDAFNAWIFYKSIVNVSLVNDSSAYGFLALRCFSVPESVTLLLVVQYIIAIGLMAFNWWAKVDAYRCIGTYCWYWGDFFYRKSVSLTFNGIFELFPHPMYTVGYSVFYAMVLITQSYTLLLVSLVAHMSQLIFLVLVEEPHMKKIYGEDEGHVERDENALYHATQGWFPSKSDVLYFTSVDIYSSSTWATWIVVIYSVLFALLPESPVWSVLQVLAWRFLHWGIIGVLLWQQSTRQVWTKHFTKQGRTLQQAFSHWKTVYNIVLAVNLFAFLACAWRYFPQLTFETIFSSTFLAKFAVLCALTFLSLWTAYSTYQSIGDFGWFYGDFFIPPEQYTHKLCYTGIYRFLNNPDTLTGHAGLYGLGIICDGWVVFALAILTHLLNVIFVYWVEFPHMLRIYSNDDSNNTTQLSPTLSPILSSTSSSSLPDDTLDLVHTIPSSPSVDGDNSNTVRQHGGPLRRKVKDLVSTTILKGVKSAGLKQHQVDQQWIAAQYTQIKNKILSNIYNKILQSKLTSSNDVKLQHSPTIDLAKSPRIDIQYTYQNDYKPSDSDWIGLYQTDLPSGPFLAAGWAYVPELADGQTSGKLTLYTYQLPRAPGSYTLRYHSNNMYNVFGTSNVSFIDSQPTTQQQQHTKQQ